MEYRGRYSTFDPALVVTYPVSERTNKVRLGDLLEPDQLNHMNFSVPGDVEKQIDLLALEIVAARENQRPVLLFTGAHLIKNGLGKLLVNLIKHKLFTMISGNGATSIHDFELGLMGETSEYVPQALEKGQFGMAFEFNYINAALIVGNSHRLGYGESVGRMICDGQFRNEIENTLGIKKNSIDFACPEISVQAACYENRIPMTIHAGIGTDVTDQHFYFDGEAKGGCSGRDFLIYTEEISKFTEGGVILNVGSAVTGPEVFLKAASMAANTGHTPDRIVTADFDLRPYNPDTFTNENSVGYYYRDQKSIVTRIPKAYGGQGYYVEGNLKQTIPLLFKKLLEKI